AGGGLKTDFLLFQRGASPEGAFQELKEGNPVYFYANKDAKPIQLQDWDDVKELAHQVRQREIQREIEEGVKGIGRGLEEAGKVLEKELEDFWKEVRK
ncbi:MAG: hypothetical protein AB1758_14000, partial [Candidatus Eremiobacterota bacterium]